MKTFPTVVTAIFAALALGAVLIFATFSASQSTSIGNVVIWGSMPHDTFSSLIGALGQNNGDYSGVTYRVVPEDALVPQLVEAIASGKGPDLVLIPQKYVLGQAGKLQPIPYSSVSSRQYQDAFIQAGNDFLGSGGIAALPFTVDPLVMYWNRSLFASAGLAQAPTYWDQISDLAPKLSKADKNGTLVQSAVALGTWDNVAHAKEIFISLLGQLGNNIIATKSDGSYQSVFLSGGAGQIPPADSALRFYTDFADPTKPVYSWNRSMPNSHDAFVAGELGIYFGFASELSSIRAANPNLDFDVAPLPQIRGGGQGGYAELTGLAIPRGAANPAGALIVAQALSAQATQQTVSADLNLPSVRRDVTPSGGADPYADVFRNAALVSFTFFDPSPSATDSIFKRMVENVSSGKLQVSDATIGADQELSALLGAQ